MKNIRMQFVAQIIAALLSNMVLVDFANGQVAGNVVDARYVREKALAAMDENDGKHNEVLYSQRMWAVFTGHERCDLACQMLGQTPEAVSTTTPALLAHTEEIDHKSTLLLDGWEDKPRPTFRNIKDRTNFGKDSYSRDQLTRALLGPDRVISMAGRQNRNGVDIYVLSSQPSGTVQSKAGSSECAAGLDAEVLVDAKTFFPIGGTAIVKYRTRCTGVQFGEGSTWEWEFTRVTGKDSCGEMHAVYVPNHFEEAGLIGNSTQSGQERPDWRELGHKYAQLAHPMARAAEAAKNPGPHVTVTINPGTAASRPFVLDMRYAGGSATGVVQAQNFRVFVTGACLVNRDEPIEMVETTIRFDKIQ